MKILLLSVERSSDTAPENQIINEYSKRIPWQINTNRLEQESNLKKTSEKMLKAIPKGYHPILLDKSGKDHSSEEFASYIAKLRDMGKNKIAFLIGPAAGFHKYIFENVKSSISLSKMTYSHKLAKIILTEQLYRSWAIFNNHPYHK